MRLLLHTCIILLALGTAACGSNPDAGGNGTGADETAAPAGLAQTDPCGLITAEEVGEIIGDKIVATKPSDGACSYETADAQASSVTIELNQTDAKGAMNTVRSAAGVLGNLGAEAASQGGAAGEDVNAMLSESGDAPNVGDEALFGPNQQLSVRKGTSYIAIQPPMMRSRMAAGNPLLSADDRKKLAIAIAGKAVGRLP
ncbi:MAG: hypothetical protein ACR2FK_00535 [Sphingomicrobium sp.]